MATKPLAPVESTTAASRGKIPDCEWPKSTAPFNLTASSASRLGLGLGDGRVLLGSVMLCFTNSSADSTGNCVSENGTPGAGPKRNLVQPNSALVLNKAGWAAGGTLPTRTSL